MTKASLHLLKLCVGAESVDDLRAWQIRQAAMQRAEEKPPQHTHVTRMWPRREKELLNGGSLYWVIKGHIMARQEIIRLDRSAGLDGINRCSILLDRNIRRTIVTPRRAFQGWRYLNAADAPPDLTEDRLQTEDRLPPELEIALSDLGLK